MLCSILLDFSLKSFLYFHGFCLQSELTSRRGSPPEVSARKYHAVTTRKDKVKNSFTNKDYCCLFRHSF